MMTNRAKPFKIILVVLSILIILDGAIPARAGAIEGEFDFQAIDQYITQQMRASQIPGAAVAIVKGDRAIYLKGYGRTGAGGGTVTPQTPFIIGSVSKSFTAIAVMQLVEAGKIDLDAPIQRYLPWFKLADADASARITIRHLLNHTSGIPNGCCYATMLDSSQDDGALERHVRFLKSVQPSRPAGKSFEYSNVNYTTLGMVIQAVSGQSYEDYMQEHVFTPLGMSNSYLSQEIAEEHGMARGHRRWFGIPLPARLGYNRGDLPAGFIISGAEDMSHFLIAQLNEGKYQDTAILSSESMAQMLPPEKPDSYGMGKFRTEVKGIPLIGHEGATFNFQSAWFIAPEEQIGVFVAANVMNMVEPFSSPYGQSTSRMAKSILSLIIGQSLPDQGIPVSRIYWVIDAVLLLLTAWLVWSLARLPRRASRLAQRMPFAAWKVILRVFWIALLHFIWTIPLIYMILTIPGLRVTLTMQPDIMIWLIVVAIAVLVKGALEVVLTLRIAWQKRVVQTQQP